MSRAAGAEMWVVDVADPDLPDHRPKCLFVGPGSWGRRLLPRVSRYFEVVALVSNGGPGSAAWSSRHDPRTPHVVGLGEALALPRIDAVFLATPPATHVALACQALEAGCHVFVEKPLAWSPARRSVRSPRPSGTGWSCSSATSTCSTRDCTSCVPSPRRISSDRCTSTGCDPTSPEVCTVSC